MINRKQLLEEATYVWVRGYACAVATLAKIEGGIDVRVEELMRAGGLTEKFCMRAGVDLYDIEILFPKKKRNNKIRSKR